MKSLRQHVNEALKIKSGTNVRYNNPSKQYFYHEALDDSYSTSFLYTTNVLQYSIDECKTWNDLEPDTETPKINKGERIYFKCEKPRLSWVYGIGTFNSNKKFNAGGNIMSLIYGDDFDGQTKLIEDYQFKKIFHKNEYLVSAKDLILPATELTEQCYIGMFEKCESLTTPPELPATELTEGCYCDMFRGCTSLTKTPKLPATKLVKFCYYGMFIYCNSLKEITMLATDISAEDCIRDFVDSVSKTGTFTKSKGIKIPFGRSGIPEEWIVKEI